MSDGNIEFSKDGIKIPYKRYLTDSTPGFILVLLLIGAYYNDNLAFLSDFLPKSAMSEVKIFVLLLLFLLATPVGVIINVIGWLSLEYFQKGLEKVILSSGFLGHFKAEFGLEECKLKFDINEKNWFERIRTLEIALVNDFPGKSDGIEVLRGIAILLRNLSLMSVVVPVVCEAISLRLFCPMFLAIAISQTPVVIIFLLIALFLFCLSAVVSFYFHVHIVRWAFILRHDEKAKLLLELTDKQFPTKS